MKIWFVLSLLIIILFDCCVFSPDGENFVKLNKDVPPPVIDNKTLDFDKDTIFISTATWLNFDLTSSNQQISNVVISYESNTNNYGAKGTFQIDPRNLQEGFHTLEMKIYTNSGTGSLADKLASEGFIFSKQWVLAIVKINTPDPPKPGDPGNPPTPKPAINISTANGFLKFSWTKANPKWFKSYKLSITNLGMNTTYSREYSDSTVTSFVDSLFVGGRIYATLNINYYAGENLEVQCQVDYNYPISLNLAMNVDSLTLTWNKNPFKHRTFYSANGGGNWTEANADSSLILVSPGFGWPGQYYLGFMPLKQPPSNLYYSIYSPLVTFMTENKQKFYNLIYLKSVNAYLLKYPMYVRRFNQSFQQTGSLDYSWVYSSDDYSLDFSDDGQKIYSIIGHKFTVLNSTTLEKIRECAPPADKFNSGLSYVLKYLNDSIFIVGMKHGYALYNINSQTVVCNTDFGKKYGDDSRDFNYAVSSNGKYAAYADKYGLKIYENIQNKELKLIFNDLTYHYNCLFDPVHSNILVANSETSPYYFDCQTLEVMRTLETRLGYPINIDPSTNLLLAGSLRSEKLFLYDYLNDKIIREYNFRGIPFDYRLYNNTIFYNGGYHYKL